MLKIRRVTAVLALALALPVAAICCSCGQQTPAAGIGQTPPGEAAEPSVDPATVPPPPPLPG